MVRKLFYQIIVLCLIMLYSQESNAQQLQTNGQIYNYDYCCNISGYWSSWDYGFRTGYWLIRNGEFLGCAFRPITIGSGGYKKDDYMFKFTINNFHKPSKKEKKQHLKNDIWYEYEGEVEYYVTEEYPTLKSELEKFAFPIIQTGTGSSSALRKAKAKIKIAPYKDNPRTFNIWVDGFGIAVVMKLSH